MPRREVKMAEDLSIQMMRREKSKKPFWLTGRGIVACAALAVVILAALLSWWLSNGTVTSLQAKMDTMV